MLPYLSLRSINAPYEDQIRKALSDVIDSGWYLHGSRVEAFEAEWARYCQSDYCVSCGNGLDALRLVLMSWIEMGYVRKGDEVIVPSNTFIATVLAVSQSGLKPVFVEPDPHTCLIDPNRVSEAITPRTRVIIPVHLYGQVCDLASIFSIARSNELLVLEDCAQCHGANFGDFARDGIYTYLPKYAHARAWSFYPGKNLGALGDAGAVTTCDPVLAEMIRSIGNYGSSEKYVHNVQGLNSRMDEFQAAVLLAKLPDLDCCNDRRISIANRYFTEIKNPQISMSEIRTNSVFHIFPIFVDSPDSSDPQSSRNHLQARLLECGIQTQIHYPIPPHRQRAYLSEFGHLSLPIADHLAATELSLPCNQSMTDEEVSFIIKSLNH